MIIPYDIPARSAQLNADATATGKVYLNSTWGFIKGALVYLSATGLDGLACEIVSVHPTYLTLRKARTSFSGPSYSNVAPLDGPNYGLSDLSAYTKALDASLSQPSQAVWGVDSELLDPTKRVSMELLNAPLKLLGTITSTGTSTNNHTTAVPFWDTGAALKELVVTVVPSVSCYIKVGTDNAVVATADNEVLQAGEKRTIPLSALQGWIAVLGVGSAAVDLKVYRNVLE